MSRPRLIALLLAVVTLAIYLPAGHYGFSFFDDYDCVSKNEVVQRGLTWSGIRWAFTTGLTGNWMPLTWISHMAVCQLFGLNAGAHHLVNVFFHAANTVLVFMLLIRLTGALWPSALAAALFAWHPLHVESVAWITERKDMLSTFFGLLALLVYVQYVKNSRIQDPRSKVSFGLALLFFALSLMSKPMLVTLPFVMLLLDYWPLQRMHPMEGGRGPVLLRLVLEKWPFFVLSAALCVITFLAQRAEGLVAPPESIPVSDRLENVPVTYSRYLLQLIWPTHLAVFYPFPKEISPLVIVLAVLALALISAVIWLGRNRSPYWLVGWLWFLGTLVPVNGLVMFGGQVMGNRFTYFPSIGIFLAVALSFRAVHARSRLPTVAVTVVAGSVLTACLALMENQLRYWRDDVSLFSHTVDITNDTRWIHFRYLGFLHRRLGVALATEGRNADAMVQFESALRLKPDDVDAELQLAIILAGERQITSAILHYRRALELDPNSFIALNNLSWLLATTSDPRLRDGSEAVRLAERACKLTHYQKPVCIGTLAAAYAEAGRFEDAIATAQMACATSEKLGKLDLLKNNQKQLEFYRAHEPYRE